MTIEVIGMAIVIIAIMLVIGKWIRLKVPLFQSLFLPSSLIGGFLALIIGPEVIGRFGGDFLVTVDYLQLLLLIFGESFLAY